MRMKTGPWCSSAGKAIGRPSGRLVGRYQKPVFNAALRLLHDPEDARDGAQTTFLKAFEHLADYDPSFKFYSWIYRIAINQALNVLASRKSSGSLRARKRTRRRDPEQCRVESEQIDQAIQEALMRINPELRAVVVLRHFMHLSYHDMGDILLLPEKTVKSRLYSARQQLRESFLQMGRSDMVEPRNSSSFTRRLMASSTPSNGQSSRAVLAADLRRSEPCARDLRRLCSTLDGLAPVEPPAQLRESVLAALPQSSFRARQSFVPRWRYAAVIAGMLAAGVLVLETLRAPETASSDAAGTMVLGTRTDDHRYGAPRQRASLRPRSSAATQRDWVLSSSWQRALPWTC